MKWILPSLLILLSWQAHAVDTSGCNPQVISQRILTIQNADLTAQSYKAPRAACWNADASYVDLTYSWLQNQPNSEKAVHFWTKLNGAESLVAAGTNCQPVNSVVMSADTSGNQLYLCSAKARLPAPGVADISLEVAPQIGEMWDTLGYQQNYFFQL